MTTVIKANGEKEQFSQQKIIDSIKRAGIAKEIQDSVLSHVESKLYENIPTSEIYRHIYEFLRKEPTQSLKYSLKQAIMNLGPTGYPFEDLVAAVLTAKGYKAQTKTILMGKCVNHEIDVIAEKANDKLMVEAKFHNAPGIHTDVHVSLYTKARYDDLKDRYKFDRPCIYTNTKVTSDALAYALCNNMGVVGWNYPQNEGLRDLIEKYKLYPITMISSLSENQKQLLLENHIVLLHQILDRSSLEVLGLEENKVDLIVNEAKQILS